MGELDMDVEGRHSMFTFLHEFCVLGIITYLKSKYNF